MSNSFDKFNAEIIEPFSIGIIGYDNITICSIGKMKGVIFFKSII